MRCIFCKENSDKSVSVEHVIPESLGNTTHILPKGVVCDRCNNYFASSVEKQFLDAPAVKSLRFHQEITNKRGRVPSLSGLLLPNFNVTVTRYPKLEYTAINVPEEAVESIFSGSSNTLILPVTANPPSEAIVSRFIAKIALESVAARLLKEPGGLDYICDEVQFDRLRDHARRGRTPIWPIHVRRIYLPDAYTVDADGSRQQVVHESDFLVTDIGEWYFVIAIFGMEFAINLGGPETSGYVEWLRQNNQASPLYAGKNFSPYNMPRDP